MGIDKLASICGFFVLFLLFKKAVDFLLFLFKLYLLTQFGFYKNLREYGKWAVITGATDGIGKEYAKQLAAQNLNVVLISRNKAKLQELAKEIEDAYSVKTKVIIFNFTFQHGYDVIEDGLKNLDIGVLINNVGMNYPGNIPFHDSDIDVYVDMLNVNMISLVKMTRMVLAGMVSRKRGAVVHISSGSIYLTVPFNCIYPATKTFVQKFVESLKFEANVNIDHQVVTPFLVQSKMSRATPSLIVPTAREFVQSAIKTIGLADQICGCFSHEILCTVLRCIPPVILVPFIVTERYKRYQKDN